MSWISDTWNKFKGAITGAAGSIFNKYTGAGLTGAEREANQFNAEQAQISRDWEAEMYERYNSPSAMMAQYQDAGLNPALMYGNAASMPAAQSTSSPAGSVAPGSTDIAGAIASFVNLRSDLDLKKSQKDFNEAQAKYYDTMAGIKPEEIASIVQRNIELANEAKQRADGLNIDNETKSEFNYWKIMNEKATYDLKRTERDESFARIDKIISENENIKEQTKFVAARIAEITEHILLLQSQKQLTEEECKKIGYEIGKLRAETKKIGEDTKLVGLDYENYVWNHAKQISTKYGLGTMSTGYLDSDGKVSASSMEVFGKQSESIFDSLFGPEFKW